MNAALTLDALREEERNRTSLVELLAMAEAETQAMSRYHELFREIAPEFYADSE